MPNPNERRLARKPDPKAANARRGEKSRSAPRKGPAPARAAALEAQLRQRPVPIIVRIAHDRCLLDMRTLFPADLDEILQAFRETAS